MKTLTLILILAGTVGTALADAPKVDAQYFHPAASFYIQGDAAASSNLVAKGLSEYPDDPKLKKLKELLEQQQQKQQQEKEDEQKQDQQDQQKQDEQDQQKKDQEQQGDEDQKKKEEQQQPEEPQPEEQQQPQRAEDMTPEEAKQLLDAMKQDEKNKRLQLHPVLGAPVRVEKDW